MIVDLKKLQKYIDDRLVSVQKHPEEELYIYNYTKKCQFAREWDGITRMCRGLITDAEGKVVSRPFDKFFNLDEFPDQVPSNVRFNAYDKFDGSLGILYKRPDGEYQIATRGSFTSDQAVKGTEILSSVAYHGGYQDTKEFCDKLFNTETFTFLFEIIYPENRIVVDYGSDQKLVFLGARGIDTGIFYTPDWFPNIRAWFESAEKVENHEQSRENSEGVVLYYENGFMCKVKYDEYVRLHRLITGVTARRIWDLLRNDEGIEELLERVPEEFSDWVKKTAHQLVFEFQTAERCCARVVQEAREFDTRKKQAEHIIRMTADARRGVSGVCFAMLDEKDHVQAIWKLLKPAHEVPFRKDTDS